MNQEERASASHPENTPVAQEANASAADGENPFPKSGRFRVRTVLVMLLVWVISIDIAAHLGRPQLVNDGNFLSALMTVLFGAASIALFVFSILIAFVAIVGWQNIQKNIREGVRAESQRNISSLSRRIEDSFTEKSEGLDRNFKNLKTQAASHAEELEAKTRARLDMLEESNKRLESEVQGRILTVLGHLLGEMSIDLKTQKILERERLAESVDLCRQAYEILKDVQNEKAQFLGLNNLVFYLSVFGDGVLASDQEKSDLLQKARLLRKVGQDHAAPKILLTASRVVLQYSADSEERKNACDTVSALAASAVSERQRNEAILYRERYCAGSRAGVNAHSIE